MSSHTAVDLTNGPTFINMVRFSVPIMMQGSFQIIYNLTDRYWLGGLNKEAVASVTVVFPVLFFMISVVIGISIGAGILIAQYYGADDKERVNLTGRNYLVIGSLFVLMISVLMVIFASDVLNILKTPPELHNEAASYLRIQFAGLIFIFSFFGASSIFRALGDSITPTIVAAVTGVINLILDPLLIFGLIGLPKLGVTGAAIATFTGYFIGAILIITFLVTRQNYVTLSPKGFKFDFTIISNILKVGLPTAGTVMMVSASFLVLMRIVNDFGTAAIAAFGIGIVLDQLVQMPSQSFGMAMSTIAGQNIGAGNLERVSKFLRETVGLSVAVAIGFSVLLWFTSDNVTKFFLRGEEDYLEVVPFVVLYIHIIVIRYIMMSIFFPVNGVIRGAGDAMASMWIVALTQLIIRVPLAIYLSNKIALENIPLIGNLGFHGEIGMNLGFIGIPIGLASSTVIGLLIALYWYRSGVWIERGKFILDQMNKSNIRQVETPPEISNE
ncbi:MAG TPA: MATE family efflux transporter [bacterium]|jgi:putative MATE family efflux protein